MTNQTGNIGLLALNDALPLSENLDGSIYVPGMGIGASKDALRWATAGMLDELLRNQKNRKPFGRPVRDFMEKVDNRRAFMLWALVNIDPISPNLKFASNRELLNIMLMLRKFGPDITDYFPNTTDTLSNQSPEVARHLELGKCGSPKFAKKYAKTYSQTIKARKLHSLPPSATTCERCTQCYRKYSGAKTLKNDLSYPAHQFMR